MADLAEVHRLDAFASQRWPDRGTRAGLPRADDQLDDLICGRACFGHGDLEMDDASESWSRWMSSKFVWLGRRSSGRCGVALGKTVHFPWTELIPPSLLASSDRYSDLDLEKYVLLGLAQVTLTGSHSL